MLDDEYVNNLLKSVNNDTDNKLIYIDKKIKRKKVEHLSISEYNYIRKLNGLSQLDINKLKNLLYDNYISYSDIYRYTGISRSMLCMILRGNRNCTIKQLRLIFKCMNSINSNIKIEDIVR